MTRAFLLSCLLALLKLPAPPAAQPGFVLDEQKISDTEGGFATTLDDSDGFGSSVVALGDLDNDGVTEVVVGASRDDDGGPDRGAVYVLFRNADGTVRTEQKISDTAGGFPGTLDNGDLFGFAAAPLGDLDGDGTPDLAVGVPTDDDGSQDRGAVWVLFLNPDGTVRAYQKISATAGGFTGNLGTSDQFGYAVASLGDLDGDGTPDLAVGARLDDDGSVNRGAVWVLFLNADGTVRAHQKISSTAGGFTGQLFSVDQFGSAVAGLGDLDGDGVEDLAVGARGADDGGGNTGAVWVLLLNADGTVRAEQEISNTQGGFSGGIGNDNDFGRSAAALGDLDGDGTTELAVGAVFHDDGGTHRGAVWVLFLNPDGTVSGHQKISDTQGGFTGTLDNFDYFGVALGALGDLDGDGLPDLAVGATGDDDGGPDRGGVWMLFLDGEPVSVPDFELMVTPTDSLTVPPGGQLSFSYTIVNNMANAVSGDFYFVARQDGMPVAQAVLQSGTLPGGQTIQGSTTLNVPSGAPPGDYELTFSIGSAFGLSVDEEGFTVTVQGAAARGDASGWEVASASGWTPAGSSAVRLHDAPALRAAYPNPFSGRTTLGFALSETQRVRLGVVDVLGREVAVVLDGEMEAGPHEAVFESGSLSSGVYLVRLETEGAVRTERVTLLR